MRDMTALASETETIAALARELVLLREMVANLSKQREQVRANLYCIGGPLNDSRIAYTKEQLRPFFEIARLTE